MLAIIPARKGSKGLPGKNIKKLNGKPLVIYTIEAAMKSNLISQVIISTNDKNIADIAINAGAKCPFMRPESLSTDTSLSIDTYLYTIDRIMEEKKISIDNIIILQPTSPLRISLDIDNAIEMFFTKNADSIISFTEEDHPIFWHKYIDNNNRFENIFEENIKNRQNNRKTYFPNGAIYIFKTNLLKQRKYFSRNSFAYIMPRIRSIDIDTIEDFRYAEYILNSYSIQDLSKL